ncbi:MAG: hypothetical protein IPO37_17700 [Saprospiraceae bacterium]|nr:hypothetical protein [Saprospiraceae bacterium]
MTRVSSSVHLQDFQQILIRSVLGFLSDIFGDDRMCRETGYLGINQWFLFLSRVVAMMLALSCSR